MITLTDLCPKHAIDQEEVAKHQEAGPVDRIQAAADDTGPGVEGAAGLDAVVL